MTENSKIEWCDATYQVLHRLADETHERLFLQWMAKWTQVAASRHQAGKAKAAEARKLQKAQGKGRKLVGVEAPLEAVDG